MTTTEVDGAGVVGRAGGCGLVWTARASGTLVAGGAAGTTGCAVTSGVRVGVRTTTGEVGRGRFPVTASTGCWRSQPGRPSMRPGVVGAATCCLVSTVGELTVTIGDVTRSTLRTVGFRRSCSGRRSERLATTAVGCTVVGETTVSLPGLKPVRPALSIRPEVRVMGAGAVPPSLLAGIKLGRYTARVRPSRSRRSPRAPRPLSSRRLTVRTSCRECSRTRSGEMPRL